MSNEPTIEAEGLRLLTDAELDAVSGGAASQTACDTLLRVVDSIVPGGNAGLEQAIFKVCPPPP